MPNYENPSVLERLIAALSYLSGGFIGVCWFIIAFFLKLNVRPFLQFHITQSVIFFLGLYIINLFCQIVFGFLLHIPFIKGFIKGILFAIKFPMYFGFSIVGGLVSIIVLYMTLGALLGKYSYLPFISDAIKRRG